MIDDNFPIYILCFVLCFAFTAIIEKRLIPRLAAYGGQPIYEDGPKWHISKKGTPTMGGLAFVVAVTLSLAIGGGYLFILKRYEEAISLLLSAGYALLNSAVGIIDDMTKLRHRENAGLKPWQKLVMQFLSAGIFLLFRYILLNEETTLSFAFGTVDIGAIYYPLTLIILVGVTNFANLTDGIDGLASGVAFAISVSVFYISCALSDSGSLISAAIMGATCAFLLFNIHPARVFMGDTGSLYLGSVLAAATVALGNPLLILLVGIVYSLEGASVVIQVAIYKLTGKRVFKMAPLHHHLEKIGWSENRICIAAILLTLLFSITAFVIYLP